MKNRNELASTYLSQYEGTNVVIISCYGDLNDDGFEYLELSDGTSWLFDSSDYGQIDPIDDPGEIHWDKLLGYTSDDIEPIYAIN